MAEPDIQGAVEDRSGRRQRPDPDDPRELVVLPNGTARQAGADTPGKYFEARRQRLEQSLFVFAKTVMGRQFLVNPLHTDLCRWLVDFRGNRFRKMALLPRRHAKTALISHCLPIHMLIQPAETNSYTPGVAGCDLRITLCGENETRACNNLLVIQQALEKNQLLKALWPDIVWDSPRKDAKVWNRKALHVPRNVDYPDPTLQAIGVDGAITGARADVLIKDDLISVEAANSATVMDTAIRWHIATRALLESESSLEYIIGTRWAVNDLYDHIEKQDPSVDVIVRAVVENDKPIYPEMFSMQEGEKSPFGRNLQKFCIPNLQKSLGSLFFLNYMNSAADPSLTDFNIEDVREFTIKTVEGERYLLFEEDPRDRQLESDHAPRPEQAELERGRLQGMPLNSDTYDLLRGRDEFLRMRYG